MSNMRNSIYSGTLVTFMSLLPWSSVSCCLAICVWSRMDLAKTSVRPSSIIVSICSSDMSVPATLIFFSICSFRRCRYDTWSSLYCDHAS